MKTSRLTTRDGLCDLTPVILLLLSLHSAGCLKCYQSTCLDAGVASCAHDAGRAELRDCSTAGPPHRVLGRAPPPQPARGLSAGRMACVTHGAVGKEGGAWKELVLKMCFVDLPSLCELLENITNSAFLAEGSAGHARCVACTTDGCNSAWRQRPAAAAALLAATGALLAARP